MEESEIISTMELATYDCEVIREYRQIHANDTNLAKVSNRDLVLKLGLSFEQMGEEVLDKIGKKDPLFLRFYNSLREVQASPFN
jgi:flagellar basal body-associated protein FliL